MVQPSDELRVRRLAERGYRWVETVQRLNDSGGLLLQNPEAARPLIVDNVHLLIIALEHLHSCVGHIERLGRQLESATSFEREWTEVRELRNWLEHEEEYLAGAGRFPDDVEAEWIARGMLEPFTQTWNDRGLLTISFMAKSYDVDKAIHAAILLWEPLFKLWNPPIESPDQ